MTGSPSQPTCACAKTLAAVVQSAEMLRKLYHELDDRLFILQQEQATANRALCDAHDRIDDIHWRHNQGVKARAELGMAYPAGPFGLPIFRDEGEARAAWLLLQRQLHGDDPVNHEPFPSLQELSKREERRQKPERGERGITFYEGEVA